MNNLGKSRRELFDKLKNEVLERDASSRGLRPRHTIHNQEFDAFASRTGSVPEGESTEASGLEVRQEHVEKTLAPPKKTSASSRRLQGRILVVEDSSDIQRLLRLFLTSAGLEVTLAVNGQNAMETAIQHWEAGRAFDVILMDMQMPVLNGYRATELLRAAGYSGTIIAFTAHAQTLEREHCLAAGCDDYLVKPIDRITLLGALTRYLSAPLNTLQDP
jgi:CheY-like chemotaxis protein